MRLMLALALLLLASLPARAGVVHNCGPHGAVHYPGLTCPARARPRREAIG